MRIVADTNVVVSAFLWGGVPKQLLAVARTQSVTLYTSAALIAELEEILAREKFAERLVRVGSAVEEILGDYRALAKLVRVTETPAVITAARRGDERQREHPRDDVPEPLPPHVRLPPPEARCPVDHPLARGCAIMPHRVRGC